MLPLPNLDDKTFEQLLEDAKKWIPRYSPGWTDYHVHDPGITLIELFSWLTEQQQYYLNQVREESEIKFLKLLGVGRRDIEPAIADVTFYPSDEAPDVIRIPKGTLLAADHLRFETLQDLSILRSKLAKVISQNRYGFVDQSDANHRGGLQFYPFGQEAEAGSSLYLGFDLALPPGIQLPVTFHLFEDYPVAKGKYTGTEGRVDPPAKLLWQYYAAGETDQWKQIEVVRDDTNMLTQSGKIYFTIPEDMKQRSLQPVVNTPHYWIRARLVEPGYELPPRVDMILINTVAASQTEMVSEELGRSNGLPKQTFQLTHVPVLPQSLVLQVLERQDEQETWVNWQRVDSLDASLPTDRHFMLDPDTGIIQFGDGVNGSIPEVRSKLDEANIWAKVYQTTSGENGNVSAGAIRRLMHPEGDLKNLTLSNRLPASGGKRSESLEASKLRARKEISESGRAVTSEDFELLAKVTPGLRVARAKAIPLLGKKGANEPGAVTVVVVPYSEYPNPTPGAAFLQAVCRHLDRHRLLTTRLHIVPPDYINVSVDARIQVKPGYNASITQSKVTERLLAFLHPLSGGVEGTGWPFGRSVYRSELYEAVGKVEGVGCIVSLRINGKGSGVKQDSEGNLLLSPISLVYSDTHHIEAVLEDTVCNKQGGCHGQ